MKMMLKIFRSIIFWLVVAVSVLLLASSLLPRILGYSVCSVRDESMEPAFPKGSLVLARPIDFADISVGDVLVFEDPQTGDCFTRNVADIWEDEQELVTVGADDAEPDPYTTAYRCVVGSVRAHFPLVGYPSVLFHTLWGKICIALLYIIWIAVELERGRASKKRGASSCA